MRCAVAPASGGWQATNRAIGTPERAIYQLVFLLHLLQQPGEMGFGLVDID